MAISTIIGQAATGDNFYRRDELVENLWGKLKNGHHVLITAPRRVGKTSVLKYLQDNPIVNYEPVYIITESVNNANEYFRKVFKELVQLLSGSKKIGTQLKELIKSKKITSITLEGLTIDDNQIDYFNELHLVIDQLDLGDTRIIFIVDEFAQTVENIIEDEGVENGKKFLEQNREIRHRTSLSDKILFVYAGSIGIENIVSKINLVNSINDLYPFNIPPFTPEEAHGLIDKLTSDTNWTLDQTTKDHLIERLKWLVPFYIQIILDELDKSEDLEKKQIDQKDIDWAINQAIQKRVYFEHWYTRLRKAYKGNDFKFAKEVLNVTSDQDVITSYEIVDLATKYEIEEDFREIINALTHDGYINNSQNPKEYLYNSPLLRIWWKSNVNF